ncbi:hypothetical protein FB192DRAFT_1359600 [Mucor lusitanicus]|uniref:Uncharacterized protein n=1 Tax=Mucor circinelloides f. lusitanicus TaxID=29924 RepID=A0A8H4BML6_MUCCL|nr:hypothetical protein FB192DRAFT_1359600 [Mucor lusitanicus]
MARIETHSIWYTIRFKRPLNHIQKRQLCSALRRSSRSIICSCIGSHFIFEAIGALKLYQAQYNCGSQIRS